MYGKTRVRPQASNKLRVGDAPDIKLSGKASQPRLKYIRVPELLGYDTDAGDCFLVATVTCP